MILKVLVMFSPAKWRSIESSTVTTINADGYMMDPVIAISIDFKQSVSCALVCLAPETASFHYALPFREKGVGLNTNSQESFNH